MQDSEKKKDRLAANAHGSLKKKKHYYGRKVWPNSALSKKFLQHSSIQVF